MRLFRWLQNRRLKRLAQQAADEVFIAVSMEGIADKLAEKPDLSHDMLNCIVRMRRIAGEARKRADELAARAT